MKCDIFHVLHPLTFVKAARSGVIGEHFQPQPAFTGRFCSRLDGAKYLLAVASARCVRQQIELMQQRTGRTFRTYRLTTGVFRKADRVGGFSNQPTALGIGQAALQRGQGILLLQVARQLVGVMSEVSKVMAIAGIAHFIE